MKLSLARLMRQPVATLKKMYQICKHVEFVPAVVIKDHSGPAPADGFVVIAGMAIPATTWALIKDTITRVDYNYRSGQRFYYIKEDQDVSTTILTADEMTAMLVAKRFEDAK
jgi:hypothetical protein